jgi:hypothetical protein
LWQVYERATDRPRLSAYLGLFDALTPDAPKETWLVVDLVNRGRQAAFIDALHVFFGPRPLLRKWPDGRARAALRSVAHRLHKARQRALLMPLPLAPGSMSAAYSPTLPKRLEPGERARFLLAEVDDAVRAAMRPYRRKVWCSVSAPGSPCKARLKLTNEQFKLLD